MTRAETRATPSTKLPEDTASRFGTEQRRAIQDVIVELPLLLLATDLQAHRQAGFLVSYLLHRVRVERGIHNRGHRETERIALKSDIDHMRGGESDCRVVRQCDRQSRLKGDNIRRIRGNDKLLSRSGNGEYVALDRNV